MAGKFLNINNFEIREDGFNPDQNKYYEGVFAQGNGYFHVRGNFEEGLADAPQDELYVRTMKSVTTEIQRHKLSKQGTYLPLIMGQHPFLEEVIINLPFFMEMKITADGEDLDMICSSIRDYRRILNMRNGELRRSFIWVLKNGEQIRVSFSRFASQDNKRLFVQKTVIEPVKGEPKIRVNAGIDAGVTTNGYRHFTDMSIKAGENTAEVSVFTDKGESVMMKSRVEFQGIETECMPDTSRRKADLIYEGTLTRRTEFIKYTALGCSRDSGRDYRQEIYDCIAQSCLCSYEQLLERSEIIWDRRWETADIKIKGCQKLQDSLRFSIYHLLRCGTEKEDRIQICAKGFAGEAYYGRYFWDSEIYLMPFYLYTDPVSAGSLAGYRYNTLEGARENARRYHCRGARYPWQSGLTGTEQCSLWEYADNEIHITADVAFGILHYVLASGDCKFLFDKGAEVLVETARFWIDRADEDEKGGFHLLNVMGPDEYSPMTKDNGFTNYMVRFCLHAVLDVLAYMEKKRPGQYRRLVKRTGLTEEEIRRIRKIAGSLPVPYDSKRDLYLQSADFEDFAPINLDDVWEDKKRAFGHYISQEKIYRSRCIKQADTIALMSLFPGDFTDHQVKTAYEYYKPLTTHDSSLSPAVHALAANRLGYVDEVDTFLERTIAVDMDIERKGAEDGIHIANCGALWQMAVLGFLGMEPAYIQEREDGLCVPGKELPCFNPRIPSFIDQIEMTVLWAGKKYRVIAGKSKVSVRQLRERPRGFLFDLDGVLTDTAEYHYRAWKRLSDEMGLSFDRSINEFLKGVSRKRSFEIILEANHAQQRFSQKEKEQAVLRKNKYYKELIADVTPSDILPGIREFLDEAKKSGILLAVASASENAPAVLKGLGIESLFDYISDASAIPYTKPDPEVFIDCMEHLCLQPWECVGFEDAAAGIEAIKAARVTAVGIGKGTKKADPDLILDSTGELSIAKIEQLTNKNDLSES